VATKRKGGTRASRQLVESHEIKTANPFNLGSEAFDLKGSIKHNGDPHYHRVDVGSEVFNYDVEATDVAFHLVNEKVVMLSYGVESTHMLGLLGIVEEGDLDSWNLLTRPKTRGAVADCLDFQRTSFIFGSPGIGKSRPLYCFMHARRTLLIHFKEKKTKFTHGARKTPVRSPLATSWIEIEAHNDGGAHFSEGGRQLMVALSENKRHGTSAAIKRNPHGIRYLGPPSLDQLSVMVAFMNSNDSWDSISRRIVDIGPIPIARYIRDCLPDTSRPKDGYYQPHGKRH
jgi:hypothetical protein